MCGPVFVEIQSTRRAYKLVPMKENIYQKMKEVDNLHHITLE